NRWCLGKSRCSASNRSNFLNRSLIRNALVPPRSGSPQDPREMNTFTSSPGGVGVPATGSVRITVSFGNGELTYAEVTCVNPAFFSLMSQPNRVVPAQLGTKGGPQATRIVTFVSVGTGVPAAGVVPMTVPVIWLLGSVT